MLLICPVRPGDTNEELRYATRSWEANLHLDTELTLMTVGYKPTWLNPDHHVEGNFYSSLGQVVFDNVRRGSEAAFDLGVRLREVTFMNDDFFCLDPVGAILPVRRNISLREHVRSTGSIASTWWPRSLARTLTWLEDQGHNDPHSFEVHRPLVANPLDMLTALDSWGPADREDITPQWRTLYGVLNNVAAYPVKDAKLSTRATGVGTPWLSTSDESWRRYGPSLRGRFQKPSRWEV